MTGEARKNSVKYGEIRAYSLIIQGSSKILPKKRAKMWLKLPKTLIMVIFSRLSNVQAWLIPSRRPEGRVSQGFYGYGDRS